MRIVADCETYPNVFTLAAEHADYPIKWSFEISPWKDDSKELLNWLYWIVAQKGQLVGFNFLNFDGPILQYFLKMQGHATAVDLYQLAMQIINSQDEDKFANLIYPSDRFCTWICLWKLHHFDNKSKMTSLKALEFNMRLDSVEDLPFPVGVPLLRGQVPVLRECNAHDVTATKAFYHASLPMIEFREQLSQKHGKDFLNHNDTKIGAEIFQMALENNNIPCYAYGANGRQPRQTLRPVIHLKECIPNWVRFDNPAFSRIHTHLWMQSITETKGVFKDLTAFCGGLEFVFGTGGIHASVENEIFIADDQMMILDLDVTSMYPSIAISQGYYPEHLGPTFVKVYDDLRRQRLQYKKGSPENAMLKLALNGVYGKSNDKFSIFYDPKFTMSVTLTGQLALAMLAERLSGIGRIIQANTDGITISLHRKLRGRVQDICDQWEQETGLTLEEAEYSRMFVADVNSYIAEYVKGGVKRKGRYEWDVEWHQDASALVVAKVAEQVLLKGVPIRATVENWPSRMDFMCRVKIPRSSTLWGSDGRQLPNMLRYYVAKDGVTLTKIMPPLAKNPGVMRHFAVVKGYKVCPCNNIADATMDIDFDYYVNEVEKLCLGMKGD